jgi:hypothetical protein
MKETLQTSYDLPLPILAERFFQCLLCGNETKAHALCDVTWSRSIRHLVRRDAIASMALEMYDMVAEHSHTFCT